MRRTISFISLLLIVAFLVGCGETVRGAVTDTKRIGSGIRKVFVSDK